MILLTTRRLSKRFAGLNAVNNVNFELPQGQIRALIGPNGAGKTTFVGLLSGRLPVSGGSVIFNGLDVTRMPAHRRMALGIAYTFQITSIFRKLPVHENVALAARARLRNDAVTAKERVTKAIERVKLEAYVNQLAGTLSYGHQRLLEIAMGLAQAPDLFILDEPTQGLSEAEVLSFIELIKDLSGAITILLIEHNMDVVMKTADQITVLNFGEILAEGTPEQIRANDRVQSAYLGNR